MGGSDYKDSEMYRLYGVCSLYNNSGGFIPSTSIIGSKLKNLYYIENYENSKLIEDSINIPMDGSYLLIKK